MFSVVEKRFALIYMNQFLSSIPIYVTIIQKM